MRPATGVSVTVTCTSAGEAASRAPVLAELPLPAEEPDRVVDLGAQRVAHGPQVVRRVHRLEPEVEVEAVGHQPAPSSTPPRPLAGIAARCSAPAAGAQLGRVGHPRPCERPDLGDDVDQHRGGQLLVDDRRHREQDGLRRARGREVVRRTRPS